jgi:hypothetical protein
MERGRRCSEQCGRGTGKAGDGTLGPKYQSVGRDRLSTLLRLLTHTSDAAPIRVDAASGRVSSDRLVREHGRLAATHRLASGLPAAAAGRSGVAFGHCSPTKTLP